MPALREGARRGGRRQVYDPLEHAPGVVPTSSANSRRPWGHAPSPLAAVRWPSSPATRMSLPQAAARPSAIRRAA